MKKISVLIPCYNEEENVVQISDAVIEQLNKLENYDYEILFIDNCSTDKTQELITKLCENNHKIKAIINCKNFGKFNSPSFGLQPPTDD